MIRSVATLKKTQQLAGELLTGHICVADADSQIGDRNPFLARGASGLRVIIRWYPSSARFGRAP
jgi:hypothetical protein